EKKNRAAARIKFLVDKWGIEKFREAVAEERAKLRPDPRWTSYLNDALAEHETPLKGPGELPAINGDEGLQQFVGTNLREQNVAGYGTVTVVLPLGDITADQCRSLADIVRKYTNGTIRTTVEQNFVIRWVSKADVVDLYRDLDSVGLAGSGASHIVDVVACP